MAAKMWDDGEEDDVDWESLVAKSIAAYRSMQPDEAMEQEEQEAATRRLMWYLERSEDRATQLIRRRYIEGASYEQMAAEEHATCSNMCTRISRAIRAVRQTLIDVYEGKSPQNLCRSSQNHGHAWRRFCRRNNGGMCKFPTFQCSAPYCYMAENACQWRGWPDRFGL